MLVMLIRWLRGYVGFTADGQFPERFINLINRLGLRCWGLLPRDGGLCGKMALSDYRRIRPTARRARVRLRCTSRSGLPFFVRRYKARKGLLVGAVLAAALMSLLSCYVWDVDIHGVQRLSSYQLYKALGDNCLRVGSYKNNVDIEALERRMILAQPEIGWISINILNNTADVEIKEKRPKPAVEDESYPCNIKASDDGVITEIIVNNGTAMVKRGSAVARNTLLVSAIMEGKHERLDYVHAKAKVMADVRVKYEINIPKKKIAAIPNRKYSEKSNISVLGVSLPFGLSADGADGLCRTYTTCAVSANNVRLPLNLTAERSYSVEKAETALDKKRAEAELRKALALRELFRGGGCAVKDRQINIRQTAEGYALQAELVVNKDIGVRQEIKLTIDN